MAGHKIFFLSKFLNASLGLFYIIQGKEFFYILWPVFYRTVKLHDLNIKLLKISKIMMDFLFILSNVLLLSSVPVNSGKIIKFPL